MRIQRALFVGFIIIVISCEALEVADFSEYPVKIEPLELRELEELNLRYHEENGNHICSTLNEFGHTGFSRVLFPGDINPCLTRDIVRVEMKNPDTLITAAKKSLFRNQEYTLVSDTSRLAVKEVSPLFGCTICEGPDINSVPIEYKITFESQQIGNTEVRNSNITVFLDSVGVNRIWGNWYPDFTTPGLINIGYLEAQRMLIGWEINMVPYTGEDIVFTVNEEHLRNDPEFEYYPYILEGILELRKTWRVEILYSAESFKGWNANIDVIDGLLLAIEPIESDQEF
ncbi:MAG: hypothetical protein ACMZ7B_08405 [Balneola sp.]